MNFKRYSGSLFVLLIPALLAMLAGFIDRSRSPFHCAAWLVAATYVVIALETVWSASNGNLNWGLVPFVLGGAAAWTVVLIGLPTFLCVLIGRLIHTAAIGRSTGAE
jgi:hypothetical protein